MQGEIMLISITVILLFNFEKNISYVLLFLRNFKISFPQFLLFTLRKNLATNLNKFCLHAVPGFATHCANRHVALQTRGKV